MKLRPFFDCRMPTLGTRAAFRFPVDTMPSMKRSLRGLKRLDASPPKNPKDIRSILTAEIKSISKSLIRLERSYYGVGKTVKHEVTKYLTSVKSIMRILHFSELSSAPVIEHVLKVCASPRRYEGDPDNPILLRDVYNKIRSFLPDKFNGVLQDCFKILDTFDKYCCSYYSPENDCYLETTSHYEEQIRTWKNTARQCLENVEKISRQFRSRGVNFKMFSVPVSTFCHSQDCDCAPFLLLFADAVTNIRTALSIMSTWLRADENYSQFLRNDINDMELKKDEKVKLMREARKKYHSCLYKLGQLESECAKLMHEVESVKEKEGDLMVEQEYLKGAEEDLERDILFKENRRSQIKKDPDISVEIINERVELMGEELRFIREKLPLVKRQLAGVNQKLHWISLKKSQLGKYIKDERQTKRELKDIEKEKKDAENEYTEVKSALELARRIYLMKTSNDAVEKIYFSLPICNRGSKLQSLSTVADGTLDQACQIVSQNIDQDWVVLYRNLAFFPKRGSHTIESDIAAINLEGAREPPEEVAANALNRWRRHHTRARVADIKTALRKIKRSDVLRTLMYTLNPPKETEELESYIPSHVEPQLRPFYREVEKFDQLRAAHKL
ncbi:hypothetical protein ScPMuIL_003506 [Solemya velum]